MASLVRQCLTVTSLSHLCKKHMMKHPQNNREVFSATPSVRFKQDTVKTHSSSNIHSAALNSEMLQKTSCFHQELLKMSDAEYTYVQKAFSVAYFLMRPLLDCIQTVTGDETLKYFKHQSRGSHQEIVQTIGDTIKTELVENVNKSLAYGLLTDEVSDISVNENLVTFIQFYCAETKKVETKFLSCRILKVQMLNAIKTLLANEVEKFEPKPGASVMTGKVGGVSALL
ncbi:hypothetical protein MAR_033199 [Mya arenaria]|uniref:DUF4371 domain-containing protein n=1 Tax=Mya arenaria TaxID=6604 RepID=A0ABY7GBD5_MYAAR|nr:hypothetical protein MAR_033199 [Mya arenaria]